MNLGEPDCRARVTAARHGVLATGHPGRGVDVVPVLYATVGPVLVVPQDMVKAKRPGRLRRVDNVAHDPLLS